MGENKVIQAIMNDVNRMLSQAENKVANIKTNVDTQEAMQDLDQLKRKIEEVEQQFQTAGGDAFTKNIQDAFANAKTQVQTYIDFINSAKNDLEFETVAKNAVQNFETLKTKFNELNQTLNSVVSNPALDDIHKKLNAISEIDIDLSQQVQKFNNYLNEMEESVKKLKQNIDNQVQLIDFGGIGGTDTLSQVNTNLSNILESVKRTKEEINSEASGILSPDSIRTDDAIDRLNTFVSTVRDMGEEIGKTSAQIKNNFGSLFSDLSNDIDENAITVLETLSDLLTSLNNNNTTIENPLPELIQSLQSIKESDIQIVDLLSDSLTRMLSISTDSDNSAFSRMMDDVANGIDRLVGVVNDAQQSFDGFARIFNNDVFGSFAQQLASMQTMMEEFNHIMNQTSTATNNPFENNLNENLNQNFNQGTYQQGNYNNYGSSTRHRRHNGPHGGNWSDINSLLQDSDYTAIENNDINYFIGSNRTNYNKMQNQAGAIRRDVASAQIANMTGSIVSKATRGFGYGDGQYSNNKLDNISDLAREYEAELERINRLRSQFDEAMADPTREDEARERLEDLNENKLKLDNLGKRLGKEGQMSNKDLKDAPREVKQVYDGIQGMLEGSKNTNTELMQLNELFGLDRFNEGLAQSNMELDKIRNSKWENFKNDIKDVGNTIKKDFISPLSGFLGTSTGIMKSGLGAMGVGGLGNFLVNPLSLNSIMGGAMGILGEVANFDIAQGRAKYDMRSSEMMNYGAGSGTYLNHMMNQGIDLQDRTQGVLGYQDLTSTYSGLTRNVIGQYGQNDISAQYAMADFTDTSLAMQKGWGVSEGSVNEAINLYYKELRMNVDETEYELAKLGQTAQSLNVPFGKHLETVTAMAKNYKSLGLDATIAGDAIGNLVFQHGMTYEDATSITGKMGNALSNQGPGWTGYMGVMNGDYADPIEAIVDVSYGYNKDGTLKEGVMDKRMDYLQDKYDMMSMFGGSYGDYAVLTTLNKDGFSNKEAGMILDAMKQGDEDFVSSMFEKLDAGTLGADGEKLDPNNPDEYFNQVFDKISQSATEQISMFEQIANEYKTSMDRIINANQELIDDALTPVKGAVEDFMFSLEDFVKNLGGVIDGMEDWFTSDGLGGLIGDAINTMMDNLLLTILGGAAISGLVKGGGKAVGRKLIETVTSSGGKNNKGNKGGGDGNGGNNGNNGSGGNSNNDNDPNNPNNPNNRNGLGNTLSDVDPNNQGSNLSKTLKTGGKWGLITGTSALLGSMLFGDNAEGSMLDGLMGSDSGSGSGSGLEGDSEAVAVLKDIYNLLAGNPTSGAFNSNGSTESTGFGSIIGGNSSLEEILAITALGTAGGMLYQHNQNKKNGSAGTSVIGGTDNDTTKESKSDPSKDKRQEIIDAEEAESKKRIEEAYKANRASGQTAQEAHENARREEDLRRNSAFNRTTEGEYRDLFRDYEDPTTMKARTKNLLLNGASSGKSALLKSAKNMLKPVPLLGSLATVGLGAWEINQDFNNIDALAHMTGANTSKEKTRSVADVGMSSAVIAAGGVAGSFIPIPVLGTALGIGGGMVADWALNKFGGYDWMADQFGIGAEDIEKDKKASIDPRITNASKGYKERMSLSYGQSINDDVAMVAGGALVKNANDLKGLSQEEQDAWATRFTEEYLAQIADGVDPAKAEANAKEQVDKLLEIQVGQEDVKTLNQDQLVQMLELYSLTGENKEELTKYSETYFKKEADSKKVLDETSKATGLSLEELKEIASSMDLLPDQLAALISMNSGGKDNIGNAFLGDTEVEDIRNMLQKNSGLGVATIEETIMHMVENQADLAAKGLNKSETNRYAEYYAGALGSGMTSEESAKTAEKTLYTDRQADQILTGKGLASKVLAYQNGMSHDSRLNIAMGINDKQVKDALSTTASASGMTEWQIKKSLERQGINEEIYTSYLLNNVDGVNGHKQGKIGKTEIDDFLGNKNDAKVIESFLAKTANYTEDQLREMKEAKEQADKIKEENKKFYEEQTLYTEDYTGLNHEDMKEYNSLLQNENQEFTNKLNETDQEFRSKLQDAKKQADSENTTSVVTALDALGSLIGSKISELGDAISSMTGLGNGSGSSSSGTLSGDDNAMKAFNFLKENGFSDQSAAAVVGNFMQESQMNPNSENSIGAFGIAQWLNGRRDNLESFAKSKGTSATDLQTQLEFFMHEIENKESGSVNRFFDNGWEGFKKSTDLNYATTAFRKGYERPGEHEALDNKRINYAQDVLASSKNSGSGGGTLAGGSQGVASYYLGNKFTTTSTYLDPTRTNHLGLDLAAPSGTDIYALAPGTVKSKGFIPKEKGGAGNYVTIEHLDGSLTKYFHMLEQTALKVGQKVNAGDFIGDVGSTGYSSGPHLHLEYWTNGQHKDPKKMLQLMAGMGGSTSDPSTTGGTGSKQIVDAIEKTSESTNNTIKESSDKIAASTASAYNPTSPLVTNASAYDPFSGIHPTSGLKYNSTQFDLYQQKGIKSIAENMQGVNMQDKQIELRKYLDNEVKKKFDVNLTTSVDPTRHPNFVQLVDKHMKVAIQSAVDEATKGLDESYTSQFGELWNTQLTTINSNKSID